MEKETNNTIKTKNTQRIFIGATSRNLGSICIISSFTMKNPSDKPELRKQGEAKANRESA